MIQANASSVSPRLRKREAPSRKLIALPTFTNPEVDDNEFKNLFHQYLSFDMPRIVALMAPPPLLQSPDDNTKARVQGVANLGLVAPVYFLLFVSMAHLLQLVRREQFEPDRISAKLYGCLMHMLREKLGDYKPTEASDLVLAVLALCSFDMTLEKHVAVNHHRAALQQLVAQAGIHRLGRSLPYVLSWDRIIAAFTAKPPLFAKMPDRQFIRSPQRPTRYGLGFDMARDELDLDADVRNLCSDVCRAIEIVEGENWTFRPERLYSPYTAAEIQYLYFLRDVIQNTCTVLQARDLHNSPKSRPIFFAAMIIQYLVLGKNDLPWYSTATANRLYNVLARQNLDMVWRGNEDVLCWLMCLMMIIPIPWRGRAKAVKLFSDWLESRSGYDQTDTLQKVQNGLCNPEDFIWHKPDFDTQLSTALKEVQLRDPSIRLSHIRKLSFSGSEIAMVSWSIGLRTSTDGSDGSDGSHEYGIEEGNEVC